MGPLFLTPAHQQPPNSMQLLEHRVGQGVLRAAGCPGNRGRLPGRGLILWSVGTIGRPGLERSWGPPGLQYRITLAQNLAATEIFQERFPNERPFSPHSAHIVVAIRREHVCRAMRPALVAPAPLAEVRELRYVLEKITTAQRRFARGQTSFRPGRGGRAAHATVSSYLERALGAVFHNELFTTSSFSAAGDPETTE